MEKKNPPENKTFIEQKNPLEKKALEYEHKCWEEIPITPVNTLQLFITNRCNLRCQGCFYASYLGKEDMSIGNYIQIKEQYQDQIEKIILLGGEPTLHPNLAQMIALNQQSNLATTLYTNGSRLEVLEKINLENVKIRLGVYGAYQSEKPLAKILNQLNQLNKRTTLPLTIVYMLRKDNVDELMATAEMAEKEFNCHNFFISSIRDIGDTHDYWQDNDSTLPLEEYFQVVQDFVVEYQRHQGKMNLHISKRGIISSKYESDINRCRFGNIFPNGRKIRCPLDIAINKYCSELTFQKNKCNKDELCLLRKIVLKNKKPT